MIFLKQKPFFSILYFLLTISFFSISLNAQIYYTQNGTNLPNPKPDTIYLKNGLFKGYDAEFGTLLVYENRSDNASKLIDIPVVRIRSYNKSNKSPIFLLNGGPGISNIWEDNLPAYLLDSFDIVMVGYRGVDGTVKLDSKNVKDLIYNSTDPLNEKNYFKLQNAWQKSFNDLNKEFDLNAYSIREVCNDIESVRKFFRYDKINFYAFSYGSMVAQEYNTSFSTNIDKNIYICARPFSENNFNYSDTTILKNTIDSLLIHQFHLNEEEILAFYHFINHDLFNIEGFDKSKFLIAALNNLYSISSTSILLEAILESMEGNNAKVLAFQDELNMHLNKLACVDCIVKRYSISNGEKTTENGNSFLSLLITNANKFWNSAPVKLNQLQVIQDSIKQPTLLIYGQNDFVSSFKLIEKSLLPKLKDFSILKLQNAAHEDVIKNAKTKQFEIIEFLKEK
jgi:pimeloyl-ACP methyl ester carboxylesterase